MKRGRKKGSSLFAKPEQAEWEEIRNRLIYESGEWRILRLEELLRPHTNFAVSYCADGKRTRQLFETEEEAHGFAAEVKSKLAEKADNLKRNGVKFEFEAEEPRRVSLLADNYLSARKAEWQSIAAEKKYVLLDRVDSLWNQWSAQCERAVLDGDADWFKSTISES